MIQSTFAHVAFPVVKGKMDQALEVMALLGFDHVVRTAESDSGKYVFLENSGGNQVQLTEPKGGFEIFVEGAGDSDQKFAVYQEPPDDYHLALYTQPEAAVEELNAWAIANSIELEVSDEPGGKKFVWVKGVLVYWFELVPTKP